jgi:hypothetical protein
MGDDRKKKAYRRKCSARIWWIGVHIYDSAVIAYNYVQYPGVINSNQYVFFTFVSVLTSGLYFRVQCSTPGYLSEGQLNKLDADIEANDGNTHIDTDFLVSKNDLSLVSLNEDTVRQRFCDQCQIIQPLRTKHW